MVGQNIKKLAEKLEQQDQLRKETQAMQANADIREEHDMLIQMLEEQLSKVTDVDLLLNFILNSALEFSRCEAGSIWIMDQGDLVLWYARNLVLEKNKSELHS